ncbi:MAG: rcc01693 family protein [Pseudomonadota bacterium]
MNSPEPFPWVRAMQFGFGVLKLSPQAFWALTPRELAAALNAHNPQPARPDTQALRSLIARFPDEENTHG